MARTYLKLYDEGHSLSYVIEDMPKLEEADIDVSQSLDEILGSMTSVKRLSLRQFFNRDDERSVLIVGAFFSQLEHVKLCFYRWIHSFSTMPRLSGRNAALFLNVCRTLLKLSSLKGSWDHKKRGIS
ncbi:hypothetical protein Bca4012_008903 [Brassica carinata]